MSALTYEIRDPSSPVARWMVEMFPHVREVQAAFRAGAGQAKVFPSPAVAAGTQGAAIDWWLRMLVAPAVDVTLPLIGLRTRRVACVPAGLQLLRQMGAFDAAGQLRPVVPAQHAARPDEWWARVCYAMALLVELYRAFSVDGSRLQQLIATSGAQDLLALANADEVADLMAMRDLARDHLLPYLPSGPVFTGMTFDGSADLAADADLLTGGMLVEFKAGKGGSPRKGRHPPGVAGPRGPVPAARLRPDGLPRYVQGTQRGRVRRALRLPRHLVTAQADQPGGRRSRSAAAYPAPAVRTSATR
jgi:hypothetical protein